MTLKSAINTSLAFDAEINKERAAGVGRTARVLEGHLARCRELKDEFATASAVRRAGITREYAEAVAEARKWHWYLCVQREAIGVFNHDEIEKHYPLPGALS